MRQQIFAEGRVQLQRGQASPAEVNHGRVGALLDGRLVGDSRDAALAEVVQRDLEFDVFADTASVLREAESDMAGGNNRASESRRAKADRLRPHVARWVKAQGAAAVAARAELKPDSVRRFAFGTVTPMPGALDAYEEMLEEEQRGRDSAESDGEGGAGQANQGIVRIPRGEG